MLYCGKILTVILVKNRGDIKMSACTFFGHRDTPEAIKPRLREAIVELIEKYGVTTFYIGDKGAFDLMAKSIIRELCNVYPQIRYSVVLAYLPQKRDEFDTRDFSDTIFPEGIESVPKRYAISWRNNWMLKRADHVICYVNHSWGGAAQFAEKALKQGKSVINLAEENNMSPS